MSDKIREALAGMLAIVDESRGVDGYHLSGDIAEWDTFPEVEIARSALAQQPAPAVPERWKLVPVEPTREMWAAAGDCVTTLQWSGIGHHDKISSAVYRAMLAAAPAAPAPAAQEPIRLSDDVREFLQEWISSATGGEDADVDYDFANQLALLLGPLYATPPAAEPPHSTTSDRYRAELYDEVWEKARALGFGNVTEGLAELERRLAAEREQPNAVKAPRELLERLVDVCADAGAGCARKELHALLGKESEDHE